MANQECWVCHLPANSTGQVPVCGESCFDRLERDPEYYYGDIEQDTLENTDYRRVLHTSQQQQLVVMSITPEDGGIPSEIHPHTSQFIRVEAGTGYVLLNGQHKVPLEQHKALLINAGVQHAVAATGDEPLKLYTIYSPPHHPRNLIQKRKGKTSF